MRKMGVVKKSAYLPMRNLILRTLAVGGVLSVALLAPNALRLVKRLDRASARRTHLYRRIRQAVTYLEYAGLIKTSGARRERRAELTEKGYSVIQRVYAEEYRIPEPAFWDGKWRIVIFDIREKRRKIRVRLRLLLQGAGFLRLQDSVWIHPYPCDEFVGLARAYLGSGTGEMLYFTAEALEADRKIREHFRLMLS